jgi:RNA-directed DNA polymerase
VLEGDIKGFFDNITHEWILKNVPMNKTVLKGWLKAGYIDQFRRFDTEMGVPQGGVISPIIANMVLDGLQEVVRKAAHKYFRRVKPAGAHLIRYADDFVVLCKSKTALKESIVPAIQEFLGKRGLWLHPTKTVISHVTNGFDFLGFNTRIYAR